MDCLFIVFGCYFRDMLNNLSAEPDSFFFSFGAKTKAEKEKQSILPAKIQLN